MPHALDNVIDQANAWRRESPGATGWAASPRPGSKSKYFMVSADTHVVEPKQIWVDRIDKKYLDRLPSLSQEARPDGTKHSKEEGMRPQPANAYASTGPEDQYRAKAGGDIEQRLIDLDYDGVDAEIIFPTRGLQAFATRDPDFSLAQCEVYNDWAVEYFQPHKDRMYPMALVPTASVEVAVRELERVAKMGFYHGIMCPVTPSYGPEQHGELAYNLPVFDPFWAALEESGLQLTFHVGTGRDPRIASKDGGAVFNLVWGAYAYSINTTVRMCASGILDRFPRLKFGIIEAGVGWVPWVLDVMDQAYLKHHMFVRPKLNHGLPSEYFKAHGFASFEDDAIGTMLAEKLGLEDNLLWANDYPHAEGSWPHSASSIERMMGDMREDTRRRILGENAARLFNIPIKQMTRPIP